MAVHAEAVDWSRMMDADIATFTARVAVDALKQEVRRGFDPQPVVVTDGMPRRDPAQVKAFGKIEWLARHDVREIARWIKAQVERLSPVLTGRYRASHVLLVNGAQAPDLGAWKPGQSISVVNPQPYAKKLEGVRTSRRRAIKGRKGASSQARAGVYRKVETMAKARFGRQAFIEFKYVVLNLGVRVRGYQGGGVNRKRIMRDHVYPSIKINPLRQIV